jgi:uncharacterized protein YidB (DUF937 family)
MSILSALTKNTDLLGSTAKLAIKNPKIFAAAASLLSTKDSSVGGSGGLADLMSAFGTSGLDDILSSWIGNGANKEISIDQLTQVLGNTTLSQFAEKAGIDSSEAGSVLAGLLPELINQLTPDGAVPESNSLESKILSLFG